MIKDARSQGFLLAECIPALFISVLIFGLLGTTFVAMIKNLSYQDRRLRARQTLEACMYRTLGDLRVAGCNPWGISSLQAFEPDPDEIEEGNSLTLRCDRRGRETRSFPDGDVDDPDERILYEWNMSDRVLRRNHQPMALEVVENTDRMPVFEWIKIGDAILLGVTFTVDMLNEKDNLTLSTKVWIRNPI